VKISTRKKEALGSELVQLKEQLNKAVHDKEDLTLNLKLLKMK